MYLKCLLINFNPMDNDIIPMLQTDWHQVITSIPLINNSCKIKSRIFSRQ